MDTDPQIAELKELVRRNIALTEDMNRILQGMRNTSRWNTAFRLLWWLVIIGAAFAAYSYFAPYITQIMDLYSKIGSISNFGR